MQALVSIVVPVYNGMPYLADLVDSLLHQTYPRLEVVLSEGGSSDGSVDFLRGLRDPMIRVITEQPGAGAAGNWTAATAAASGEFVKLICQDDLLYPDAIAIQVADLQAHPTASMAIARRDIVDARGQPVSRARGLPGIPDGLHAGSDLIRRCYLDGTNIIGEPLAVLFRTPHLQARLPWTDDNPLMLDLAMYQRVADGSQVVTRGTSIGAFRVSASSWSTRMASQQVGQTRDWQQDFAARPENHVTFVERLRAGAGRTRQTSMRRIAYRYLQATRRLGQAP